MNTDIRLSVEFVAHHKTLKLRRRLGADGVLALLGLWLWAARNRPDGALTGMDDEDIEICAGWNGESGKCMAELLAMGFLEHVGDEYAIHTYWDPRKQWEDGTATQRKDRREKLPGRLRDAVMIRDDYRCRYCGSRMRLSVDHVMPVIRGGGDEFHNLVTACRSCNSRKGGRTPREAGMIPLKARK